MGLPQSMTGGGKCWPRLAYTWRAWSREITPANELWEAGRTTNEDAVEEKTAEREYPHRRTQRHVPYDRGEHLRSRNDDATATV